MSTREHNEKKFGNWKQMANGGRHWQEIYDGQDNSLDIQLALISSRRDLVQSSLFVFLIANT